MPFDFALIIQNFGRINTKDALKMRYLGGHDGEDCTYPTELRSNVRRVFHHFTMYGFIFYFIATVLGAIYLHNLNKLAGKLSVFFIMLNGVLRISTATVDVYFGSS